MDSIKLTGVTALGTHGVLDFEHSEPQPFVVDAVMYLDLSDASRSDDLADTVSYAQIADRIVSVIKGEHCDLIERLAQRIADSILLSWRVKKTIVTVHKPQAPIDADFGDVSVTIERLQTGYDDDDKVPTEASLYAAKLHKDSTVNKERADHADEPKIHTAVIGLGGNIGDVPQTLRAAIVAMDAIPGNQITGISALYTTKPWGVAAQDVPDFTNAVVELTTVMDPQQLLNALMMIEAAHGRTREVHWDSRPLDLDIIDYDGVENNDPDITLPHPRAWQRAFVLKPWLDINPGAVLAGPHGADVAQLVNEAPDAQYVEKISDNWILGGDV